MNIGIIGTGAMACFYAHRFASAQHSVTVIGSWQSQIDALNEHGITLIETKGSTVQRVRALSIHSEFDDFDIVFVITKANRTESAAVLLQKIKTKATVTIQNGLGNFEILKKSNPHACIITAASTQGARIVKEGVVENTGNGITHFAISGCDTEIHEMLESLFSHSHLEYRFHNNADSVIWGKLLVNAGINALTAILDVNNGFLVENKIANKMMMLLAKEVEKVATESGISLPFEDPCLQLVKVCEATAANTSSMRADVLRNAKTEIQFINGAVVKQADLVNVQVDANQFVVNLIHQIESREIIPGLNNLTHLQNFLIQGNT